MEDVGDAEPEPEPEPEPEGKADGEAGTGRAVDGVEWAEEGVRSEPGTAVLPNGGCGPRPDVEVDEALGKRGEEADEEGGISELGGLDAGGTAPSGRDSTASVALHCWCRKSAS